MSAVYTVIANHKRVTRRGIIHATNLPESRVDEELKRLINEGKIKMDPNYQDKGDTINIPVYRPVDKFQQPTLFADESDM